MTQANFGGVGGSVVYFTFLVIHYGFVHIAGMKSNSGKGGKVPNKEIHSA